MAGALGVLGIIQSFPVPSARSVVADGTEGTGAQNVRRTASITQAVLSS